MSSRHLSFSRLSGTAVLLAALAAAAPAMAQVTPAAGYTPPDDTPKITVGATIFADYTIQQQPKITDADGDSVTLNQFQIGRSYINVAGNISHSIAFRITPDITRETGVGSSLNGSYTFRLKYAYAQWNLDDYMTHGSWARFGQQQTPYVDFMEGIYRYRFQGTIFEEREGLLSSSDVGASFHYNLPQNWGDFHAGVYNGETYTKPEANDQKGWMFRGTVRPLARSGILGARGLRVTGFIDGDHYVKSADRRRGIVSVSFEHQYLNAAFDYLATKDQNASATKPKVDGRGFTVWATPRSTKGWEGLIRYDSFEPSKDASSQQRKRTIAGVSYWFPHQGNVSTALLFDVDNLKFDGFTPSPATATQRRFALHALVNF
ncbi:MAG TPA: hypothetical protein VL225_20150 [Vicinamibacterales bacterium]|nr:hypothetical protein [Vicinamibacterales bacterium]